MPPRRGQFPPMPSKMGTRTGNTLREKTDTWRRIVRTNPARVVRVLRVSGDEPTTVDGDSFVDSFPATLMVMEAARGVEIVGSPSSREWNGLVEAGVVEALCLLVIRSRLHPDTPKEGMDLATKSAFHWPFEALSNACTHIQRPPTEIDKRLVKTLKEHWPDMMERLWEQPDQSLLNDEGHVVERLIVAQTAAQILQSDPTFFSIIYDPKDLTIPVITRHWTHATAVYDTRISAQLLSMYIAPTHPLHVAYSRHFSTPPPSALLSRIYFGAGPLESSSSATQASALISTLAAHLVRLPEDELPIQLELFFGLLDASSGEKPDEILHALRTSTAFWKNAFAVLKRPQPARVVAPPRGPPPAAAIVGIAANVLHQAQFESPREREPLIRIWLDMGLFTALDNAVPTLVQFPGMTMQLTRIWMSIADALRDASPGLLKLLRAQFPRWKLVGFLIRHDIELQQGQKPVPPEPGKVPAQDAQIWDHSCWQALVGLQLHDFDWTLCARRGCGKKGAARCAQCNEVQYCGQECQKKDWKEHKLCCGQMGLVKAVERSSAGAAEGQDAVEEPAFAEEPGAAQQPGHSSLDDLS